MATDILMPALSPTMTAGTLARWLKKEGEQVESGDLIAEIETDKATMEVEAVDDGILGRLLVEEGTADIAVNTPIAILVEEGEAVPDQPVGIGEIASPQEEKGQPSSQHIPRNSSAPSENKGKRIFISPLARRLAKERGLDIVTLTGTGPNGRILRRDIETGLEKSSQSSFVDKSQATIPAENNVERMSHSTMRKVIARRLTESKTQIPHFYVSVDIELDALLMLRSKLNKTLEAENVKLSVNDMMIRAVALALKQQPGLNVQFTDQEMLHFDNVDIAMAVSVPDGLVTPIIKQADKKTLRQISAQARDLAKRARDGKLAPEEFQGGTFSISNMGMFGVKDFAAIINPPQAAILAIASGEKRAVVRDGELGIATVMTVTLSVDHRAVDGALGAKWLNTLRDLVQNPYSLVI